MILLIRTRHDLTTQYTFTWSEPILKEAEKRNLAIIKMEGAEVNFNNLEKRMSKIKPKVVLFNGHGNPRCFLDNSQRELINLESADMLKDTITCARSCDSLVELGPKAVQAGCTAFIGYAKKFVIPRLHTTTCKPLQDNIAKPVMECSNVVMMELLKNNTVEMAVDKSHKLAEKKMMDLIYSPEPFASAILFALTHNDFALGFCGDGKARR